MTTLFVGDDVKIEFANWSSLEQMYEILLGHSIGKRSALQSRFIFLIFVNSLDISRERCLVLFLPRLIASSDIIWNSFILTSLSRLCNISFAWSFIVFQHSCNSLPSWSELLKKIYNLLSSLSTSPSSC